MLGRVKLDSPNRNLHTEVGLSWRPCSTGIDLGPQRTSQTTFTLCRLDVVPTSQTLDRHQASIESRDWLEYAQERTRIEASSTAQTREQPDSGWHLLNPYYRAHPARYPPVSTNHRQSASYPTSSAHLHQLWIKNVVPNLRQIINSF